MSKLPRVDKGLLILLSLLLISPAMQLAGFGSSSGIDTEDTWKSAFTIEISSELQLDSDGLWLSDIEISADDGMEMGFSSGDPFQVQLDPSPGSIMLPWITTVVRLDRDIKDCRISLSRDLRVLPDIEVGRMPRATNPWEAGDHVRPGRLSGSIPSDNLQWSSAGYVRIDQKLHRVYTIYYLPFMNGEDGSSQFIGTSNIEVALESDPVSPTPSRIEGDPKEVQGTVSVTEFLDLPPRYLIITGGDLVDELQELAAWRNEMGVLTSVVSIEDILSSYNGGGDDADILRQYLKDVLDDWGVLEYVLLAGDWETVPVKSVHDSNAYSGWDDGTIPADSYFQCLDGTWDLDGDGLVAEPGDIEDPIPDIVVSRLAIDDPLIWSDKIAQIKEFESSGDQRTWSEKALLVGANTHNEGDGSAHSDYLWNKYLDNVFQEKLELYEDEGELSRSALDQSIGDGVSFVQFVDHGGPTVWCDDYGAGVVYSDRDARELENGAILPFVSTLACLTTWFDDTSGCPSQRFSEGLGEAFTENTGGGALSYVGSSRTSVGILGVERYLPYDNGLQEDIARQIGGLSVFTTGSVHTGAKTNYAESWSREFSKEGNSEVSMCWLEFTLLGEPITQIWTSQAKNLLLDVEHEDDLDPYVRIIVTDEVGIPEPDVNVTLQNFNRGVFEKGVTDEDGMVEFQLQLDWFCDINLTASKHDHVLFKDYISISDVIPPTTEIVTIPEIPDGQNGWFITEPNVSLVPNEKAVVHYSFGSSIYETLNGSGNYSLDQFGEGEYAIHFFGEDIAGNLEIEKVDTIKIDLKDPNITASVVPSQPDGSEGWYTTEPHVTLSTSGDDPGSDVEIFYMISSGNWERYGHPFFVPEGEKEIQYYAVDASGRTSNISTLRLKVDTSSPLSSIEIEGGGELSTTGWYLKTPTIHIFSNEERSQLQYRLGSGVQFKDYNAPFDLGDGDHELHYRAVDLSGNVGPTSVLDIRVDTSPPTLDLILDPPLPNGENGFYITRPEIDYRCSDNIDASLMLRMDDGDWVDDVDLLKLDDGQHILEAYAVDPAGNQCQYVEMEFKIDTTAPSSKIEISGTKNGEWYTSMPLVQMSADPDAVIRYGWDPSILDMTYDGPINTPGREGTFNLYFHAEDMAGNQEEIELITLNVDNKDPVLRAGVLDSGGGEYLIDCSDSKDGTRLEFRISVEGQVIVDWTEDDLLSITLERGSHTLMVEARDQAGNTDSTFIDVYSEPLWITLMKVIVPAAALILLASIIFIFHGRRKARNSGSDMSNYRVQAVEMDD